MTTRSSLLHATAIGAGVAVLGQVVGAAPTTGTRVDVRERIVHRAIAWVDSTRPEPWTPDPDDRRAMLVLVSYRAEAHEPRPLVLLSTGRDVGPSTYGDLADALVGAGYVVAIVDHVGERSGQRLPDGTGIPNRLEHIASSRDDASFRVKDSVFSRRWVELRADDLISARRHLLTLAAGHTSELAGLLNDRVAAVGHSLGGLTAAKACERDAGFAACANLDGLSYSLPMQGDGPSAIATQPFLFLGKPIPRLTDAALARAHMSRAEDDAIVARFARRFDDVMQSVQGGSYRVLMQGAGHMDFAGDGNGDVARAVRAYLIAFLDRYVRGVPAAILDAPPTNLAITITRYPSSR